EANHCQGVPGEAFPAQHHHPPDSPTDDGYDRSRLERRHHERVRQHLLDVGDRVPAGPRIHRWSSTECPAGTSGCPTTNNLPERSRSPSMGIPYSAVRLSAVITCCGVPLTAVPPQRYTTRSR